MRSTSTEQLPIRTISSLTGVNAITLRAWERRYGLIQPLRTPKGHRLYTHSHVEQIRRVLMLVERGVPISRVRELLDSEPRARARPHHGPFQDYLEQMAAAIARFDEFEIDRVYDQALSLHPIEQVTKLLLLPLLAHLGERWGSLSGAIAEEHFFAMYLRSKLGARLQHSARYASGPRIVAACAPGEQHEIGLLLFALEANAAGLRTVLLGANTPFEDVALAQQHAQAQAVVISSSVAPAPELLKIALQKLTRQIGAPVFVGGSTALTHRQAIAAAGAIALGADIQDGVQLIVATLKSKESKS